MSSVCGAAAARAGGLRAVGRARVGRTAAGLHPVVEVAHPAFRDALRVSRLEGERELAVRPRPRGLEVEWRWPLRARFWVRLEAPGLWWWLVARQGALAVGAEGELVLVELDGATVAAARRRAARGRGRWLGEGSVKAY